MRRGVLVTVGVLGVLLMAGIAGYYSFARAHYVSTRYAYVEAPFEWIRVPTAGMVRHSPRLGQRIAKGQVIIRIQPFHGPSYSVAAKESGTVGAVAITDGSYSGAGQPAVAVIQLRRVYVMAEVPESQASKISLGDRVDIRFTSRAGSTYRGTVTHIGAATLRTLSPLIHVGTFSKTVQWVPVTIRFNRQAVTVLPGETASVTVRI